MNFEHYKSLRKQLLSNLTENGEQAAADIRQMHPLVLAYIGDAIFSVKVRMRLIEREKNKVRVLHDVGAKMVSAVMQSKAYDVVAEILDEDEQGVARRGRNAKSTVPKSASVHEYRQSTALEALLGYLFLTENYARLDEIFELSFETITAVMVGLDH